MSAAGLILCFALSAQVTAAPDAASPAETTAESATEELTDSKAAPQDSVSPASGPAATTRTAPPQKGRHRFHVSASAIASGYLSDTRTMGGVGFSLGLRDLFLDYLLFEADVGYLFMIGNVLKVRTAFGVQLPGFFSPAATVDLAMLIGDRFAFIQPGRPIPSGAPTLSLGLQIAPFRFQTKAALISALQVGIALGTEFPGFGPTVSVSLLEIAVPLN